MAKNSSNVRQEIESRSRRGAQRIASWALLDLDRRSLKMTRSERIQAVMDIIVELELTDVRNHGAVPKLDRDLMHFVGDILLVDTLKDPSTNKVSRDEYPVLSDDQLARRGRVEFPMRTDKDVPSKVFDSSVGNSIRRIMDTIMDNDNPVPTQSPIYIEFDKPDLRRVETMLNDAVDERSKADLGDFHAVERLTDLNRAISLANLTPLQLAYIDLAYNKHNTRLEIAETFDKTEQSVGKVISQSITKIEKVFIRWKELDDTDNVEWNKRLAALSELEREIYTTVMRHGLGHVASAKRLGITRPKLKSHIDAITLKMS